MVIPPHFDPLIGFGIEFLFTVIAVVFCFLIYFKTKESYDLTRYEGIKYFRGAFLFFGLSYVLRFILSIIMFSRMAFDFFLPQDLFVPFFIMLLGYFSTIGIFYLIFSSIWKNFKKRNLLILGHGISVLLSIISFITRSHLILLYLQCALLIIAVILSFIVHTGRKKLSEIRVLYLLVAVLWLINLLTIDRMRLFFWGMELFFQVISLAVFIILYLKISKWIK